MLARPCLRRPQIGKVSRPGIASKSSACGALCAFQAEVDSGNVDLKLKLDDVEQSMLKQVCVEIWLVFVSILL